MAEHQTDTRVTYYVIQGFTKTRGGVAIDRPIEAPNRDAALRSAARLAASKTGVIAFCRTGDLTTGEFGEAHVLAEHGQIPSDFAEMMTA